MSASLLACPVAGACESCGSGDGLAVHEADTAVGVTCLTLCAACADAGRAPRLSCGDAVHRALVHACHQATDPSLNGVRA